MVICRTKKEGSTKKSGGANVLCFDENGNILNGKKNKSQSIEMPVEQYKKITLAGLNEILVKLDLRKSTTVSPNSGGTKLKKIEKILKTEGGQKLLSRKLLIGKTQTEDESAIAVKKANAKAKALKDLKSGKNGGNVKASAKTIAKAKAMADLKAGKNKKLVEYKVPKVKITTANIKSVSKLGKSLPKDKSGFLKVKSVKKSTTIQAKSKK